MFPILVAIAAIVAGILITYRLYQVPTLPILDYNRWWGTGSEEQDEDMSVRPFKIEFNDTIIQDLKQRLKNKRPLTKPLEGIQSQYGMNTDYLEKILNYWVEKYDFKERENLLNKFPHYKTRIQGLDIHFIRVKPQVHGKKVLPLLMLHGWPSSSKEFVKVIPMLTTPKDRYDFVFEVIAVDLPGFGFSEGSNKPGLNPVQMAIIIANLMTVRLGIEKFYIQAGDWGSQVASYVSTIFPAQVLGYHTNMPISSRPISNVKILLGSWLPWLTPHSERIYPLKKYLSYIVRESGYFHIQATKPDTIGVGLTDSPAGLAAYMMEKIAVCCNRDQLSTPHGGLENLDLDDVLDTVTITWVNNCIVTSSRIYAEGYSSKDVNVLNNIPTKVPTAAIKFKYEVVYQPDWILRDKFPNLVHSTVVEFGGHFAALHTPQELVDDVFAAVTEFIKFNQNTIVR